MVVSVLDNHGGGLHDQDCTDWVWQEGSLLLMKGFSSVALLSLLFLLLEPLALLLLPLLKLHGELAQPVRQVHPPQLSVVLDSQLREDRGVRWTQYKGQ